MKSKVEQQKFQSYEEKTENGQQQVQKLDENTERIINQFGNALHTLGQWDEEDADEPIADPITSAREARAALRSRIRELTEPKSLNVLAVDVHAANAKWWISLDDGVTPLKRNKGELLMLIVSEIAEALEGERKDLMDDKLPHRKMAEVELADAIIRILDYAAGFGYDLDGAYHEKMAFNAQREDHKHEARKIAGGKQF